MAQNRAVLIKNGSTKIDYFILAYKRTSEVGDAFFRDTHFTALTPKIFPGSLNKNLQNVLEKVMAKLCKFSVHFKTITYLLRQEEVLRRGAVRFFEHSVTALAKRIN